MPRCPNCNYTLVLLEHRRKYKCPRCSRLYPEKEIELKEFVEFNKRERQRDKEELTEKKGRQKPLTDFEKKQNARASYQKWKQKNPNHYKNYYEQNKSKILAKQKEYRIKSGKQIKERLKVRKMQNIEDSKRLERIKHWRRRQKSLAQHFFEFEVIKPYNTKFEDEFPTLALSYLLCL